MKNREKDRSFEPDGQNDYTYRQSSHVSTDIKFPFNFTIVNITLIRINEYIGPQYRTPRKTSSNRPVSPNFINFIPQFCSIFYKDSYDTQLMAISFELRSLMRFKV